jgi:hypothetical protein
MICIEFVSCFAVRIASSLFADIEVRLKVEVSSEAGPVQRTAEVLTAPWACDILTSRMSRGGEMADATDLKSVGSNPVRVRIPPSAPIISIV